MDVAAPPIERLRIVNYRVLRDVELEELSPLTVLFGPNGSGKSTVIDVLAFLREAFTVGLRPAWDRRSRIGELRSRGSDGPVMVELDYRERPADDPLTYRVAIDEQDGEPVVVDEILRWSDERGAPELLRFRYGAGVVYDERADLYVHERLESADLLAAGTLGQLSRHPRAAALRRFVTGWYLPTVSAEGTRSLPEPGVQEQLSPTGGNLPNVIQYLQEHRPEQLERVLVTLRSWVPGLESVEPEQLADGRLALRLKDAAFEEPILARFASDGTLKLLAYLTILLGPTSAPLVGIEEPDNELHPRLLPLIVEEVRSASQRSQMFVTTHSPQLVDALVPRELWALHRGEDGFARITRASEVEAVIAMVEAGGHLGDLWMEGYFGVGDPLFRSGGPA